ncbi:hypothetical protein ACTXL0_02640 [Psychrobacter faecalis]
MTNPSINFQEEFSSKIPALTLLTTLGYQLIQKQLLTDKKRVVVNG